MFTSTTQMHTYTHTNDIIEENAADETRGNQNQTKQTNNDEREKILKK